MGLTRYSFGDLIELCLIRNSDGKYNEDSAIGVNIDKEIRIMKGDTTRKELKKFYVVNPDFFVYNPRGSRKLGIGYNNSNNTYITTFNNIIFRVKDEARKVVLPQYLFIYLSRSEWDRKAEMFSWGSSTEVFSWDTFCGIEIDIPDISTQQKYLDIYNALLINQQSYEQGIENLKWVCDGYIDELRKISVLESIGKYLILSDARNERGLGIDAVRGLAVSKEMIATKADINGVNLDNYKIVDRKSVV